MRGPRAGVAAGLVLIAASAGAQVSTRTPDLEWAQWIPEFPLVDLSGRWTFVPDSSDPMIEEWRDLTIIYRIQQHSDRIEMEFQPEEGEATLQTYRWDSSVLESRLDGFEIRERAGWRNGGRTFFVEGRRWQRSDSAVRKYELAYALGRQGLLELTQSDDFGTTVWRFRRSR